MAFLRDHRRRSRLLSASFSFRMFLHPTGSPAADRHVLRLIIVIIVIVISASPRGYSKGFSGAVLSFVVIISGRVDSLAWLISQLVKLRWSRSRELLGLLTGIVSN